VWVGGGVVVAAVGVLAWWLGRTPQIGADPRVFATVDALYTAVRNEDARRVDECAGRLRGYREAGALPAAAADHLDRVIGEAKGGRWRPAAERLYAFMSAQRRDGPRPAAEHPAPAPKGRQVATNGGLR
jgi:hypothetical protein